MCYNNHKNQISKIIQKYSFININSNVTPFNPQLDDDFSQPNFFEQDMDSFNCINDSNNIQNNLYTSSDLTIKQNNDINLFTEEENTTLLKKRGRKKKSENNNSNLTKDKTIHTKMDDDNIIIKIKTFFLNNVHEYINGLIQDNDKKLIILDPIIKISLKKDYNMELWNTTFKNIYIKEKISVKYSEYPGENKK